MDGTSYLLLDARSRYGAWTHVKSWPSERRLPSVMRSWLTSRYTNSEGDITGLAFSPTANLVTFTAMDGSFTRWTDPVPSSLPSPITSDTVQAKKLDKLLDDEFGDDDDLDLEDRGEDLGDDWLVDDDGGYREEETEKKWSNGRTEVGTSSLGPEDKYDQS